VSVTAMPDILTSTANSASPELSAPEVPAASELLLASAVSTQIVVPADARPTPRRRRKAESVPDPEEEIARLQTELEQEQRINTIQRAIAEQARRVADCQTASLEALLEQTAQPCFALDTDGVITRWNPAMAFWTRQTVPSPLPLAERTNSETAVTILRACRLALAAITDPDDTQSCKGAFTLPGPLLFGDRQAAHLTLIPRFRIPGCVESFLLLVTPDTAI
jgi:hypothetical protein